MSELKRKTVNGIKWRVGSDMMQKFISFASSILVARILGPENYGIFAFSLIIIGSFELFKTMGIDSALIRKQVEIEKSANTAFVIIPFIGIILYLVLFIASPMISIHLRNPDLQSVLRILGLVFVMSCFAKVPATLLEKNMRFKTIASIDFCSSLAFSITSVIFAFLGFSFMALVFAYILKILVYTILIWISAKWKPKLEFDLKIAFEMFAFGKYVFFNMIVSFFRKNLDNFLVGKILGMHALGLYAISFNISNFMADYLGGQIYKTTYPAFSKLQSSLDNLRGAFLKTLKFLSLAVVPYSFLLFLFCEPFLKVSYGNKWIGADKIIKILVFAGFFNTLPVVFNAAFLAIGKSKIGFIITLFQVIIFASLLPPMAKMFELSGVALIVSISSFLAFVLYLYYGSKILKVSLMRIYSSIKPSFLSSLATCFFIFVIQTVFFNIKIIFPAFHNFSSLLIFALIFYSFFLYRIDRSVFKEIKELIRY